MRTYNTNDIRRRLANGLPFCLFTLLLLLTGCDEWVARFMKPDNLDITNLGKPGKQEVMQVHKVEFAPDYKTFTATTRMYGDIGPYSLTDTSRLRIDIHCTQSGIGSPKRSQPRLLSMQNVKSENFAKNDVEVLALIDLTQPQEVLDRIHDHLVELHAVFNDSNLRVAFINSQTVSPTMPATNYVIDNYLKTDSQKHALLYRSVSQKYNEMLSRQGPWAAARHMALLIFSDSEVYSNDTNKPIDPDHYLYEEDLTGKSIHPDPNIVVCYASMNPAEREELLRQDILVLLHLCQQTKGTVMYPYSGTSFKDNLLQAFHISPDANKFVFENPDGKVYCGSFETLTVGFYSRETDTLVTSFKTVINKGNFYNPIIVHGVSTHVIVMSGILIAGLIILLTWLLLQFVVPFISYRLFCHQYVVRYTGTNMSIGKNLVAESCYLCKEPFDAGDEVVVKCPHTMHKTCWDENGYHCTEHSDRCKHGSHYYNSHNLLDTHNAPFYMRWIIAAIIATTLAWIMFISRSHRVTAFFVEKLVLWFNDVEAGTPQAASLLSGNIVSPSSSFGFSIGLFLTLAFVIESSKLISARHKLLDYLLRSLVAAVLSYLVFLVTNVVVVIASLQSYAFLLEWIPWVLTALVIIVCGTYHTRIHLRKSLILPSLAVSILSMYVWWMFYANNIDYRLVLLLGFIFFGVGLAACIATVAPKSERYFLHVQGAVKPMDIAVYKWFRNAPERVVTIGKSLDCSLQLSWDLNGTVAPVHAQISMRHNVPYLTALEDGVVMGGKILQPGKDVWLHHGSTFTIGNTTFTYVEKDIQTL